MTIFYYCPADNKCFGGIKVIYDHVDILNRNGFKAYVLHFKTKDFRCDWFKNQSPIAFFKYKTPLHKICPKRSKWSEKVVLPNGKIHKFNETDIIVLPEIYGSDFSHIAPKQKKVIFNQGTYLTFKNAFRKNHKAKGYLDKNIIGCMSVSKDGMDYLTTAFPTLNLQYVRNAINTDLFNYSDKKKPIISYIESKNCFDLYQIIEMLKLRGKLAKFEFVAIKGKSQKEVAKIMQKSVLFLNVAMYEGFGLPPAEAMACGAIAVGYHGNGGREYWHKNFSYPHEVGEISGIVKTIETLASDWLKNPKALHKKMQKAAEYISDNYSLENQEKDLVKAWRSFFKS